MLTVTLDTRKVKKALKLLEQRVGNAVQGRDSLLSRVLDDAVQETRRRLHTQGNGSWRNLTRTTAERTGRSKANLAKYASRIKKRIRRGQGEVYFDARGLEWDMTQHHEGYSVGATTANMAWRTAGGKLRVLRSRRPFTVGSRRIWLGQDAAKRLLNKHAQSWISAIEREL